MPKLFEAPTLRRYGSVGEITASDYKCTPGGDGGFTYWDHTPNSGSSYRPVSDQGSGGGYVGPAVDGGDLLSGSKCRGVTQNEKAFYDIDTTT